MLPGEEEPLELEAGEAADELLARLLDAHRYRGAAEQLRERIDRESGYRYRSAPLPPLLRRASLRQATSVYDPRRLAEAIGTMLVLPKPVDVSHMTTPKVSVAERLAHLRALLRRGTFRFDEAVARADRVTIAVTLFAVLELYKQGELVWTQEEPFGEITISSPTPAAGVAGGGVR
jgi:segregation and condensation protein A